MPPRTQPLIDEATLRSLYFDQNLSIGAIARVKGTNVRLVRDSFTACGLEWRDRSKSATVRVRDDALKQAISRGKTGVRMSDQTKLKIGATLKGRPVWNVGLTAQDDPRVEKQRVNSSAASHGRPEWRANMSRIKAEAISKGHYWGGGYHESPKAGSVRYMSGWEERRWIEFDLDPSVLTYKVQPCRIPYVWQGDRNYVPDALIFYADGSIVLEEVKPSAIVKLDKGGQISAKFAAARPYAESRGWTFRVFGYG
mgnify:CR=1 FL=1